VRLADGSALGADRVILSAGVFGSPGLLLRSGIGPAADLRALGIQVIGDLPGVGGNLADHPAVEVALDVDGPARTRPQLHSIASWHSSAADKAGTPDLLFWLADPIGDPAEFSIEVVLLKPRSRGRVTLRSRDAADPPSIQLPGVDRPEDAARLAEGVSLALAVAGGPDLAAVARPSPGSPGPGADLAAFVATEHYSIPHTVGTCAAGTSAENGAVVDSNGRVHGLSGLYVVDASILPEPLSGFPNLVTMAVAEAIAGRLGSATPTDT
jgi:choline dehydrogenase